mmetsp:Transcript_37669/g.94587  ORF Transcript_37669/g.94587 Transcript_37669/m.94587 type:complete len:439 (+) Transcript_37669:17-1333(+)
MVAVRSSKPLGETPLSLALGHMSALAGAPAAKGSDPPSVQGPGLEGRGDGAASEQGSEATAGGAAFAAAAAQVAEQRERLGQLQAKVRSLRLAAVAAAEKQDQAASAKRSARQSRVKELHSQNTELARQAEVLRGETRRGDAAVAKLREVVSAREKAIAELRGRLEQAEQRMQGLRSDEGKRLVASNAGQQATILRRALAQWDVQGGTRRLCSECFAKADTNHDSKLEWNNGEIKQFVHAVFLRCGATVPMWGEMAWYKIYRHSDADGSLSLELEEAYRFARFCFEVALRAVDPLGVALEAPRASELSPTASGISPVSNGDSPMRLGPLEVTAKIQAAITAWKERPEEMTKVCRDCFSQTDCNGDNVLHWNNDEIRRFMRSLLARYHIPLPTWPDQRWYDLYRLVDLDRSRSLDASECEILARRLLEELSRSATASFA